MNILHLMSCRGWSSDAYWAARISTELERAGHRATLVCKRDAEARVIRRARDIGASRVETLAFKGAMHTRAYLADLRRLLAWLGRVDVVHVHRGKEHWLAAVANRLARTPRPVVRTRHIVQPIRAHALNRWLYRSATDLVVTVSDAIRRQYLAAELVRPEQIVSLPGGVDAECFHPGVDGEPVRRRLGVPAGTLLIGLVAGLRAMKGHRVVLDAAGRLTALGRRFHLVLAGQGSMEPAVRGWIADARLADRVSVTGFVADLPASMTALDIALYTPIDSEGMSRVLFEYLAAGRPVVASRVGVVPEVLADGESALLVPAGEAAPLAEALERLLADPQLRNRLGAAGAKLVRARLSGASVAARLVELYASLIPPSATHPR